jgi:hypothetical protein
VVGDIKMLVGNKDPCPVLGGALPRQIHKEFANAVTLRRWRPTGFRNDLDLERGFWMVAEPRVECQA